jgi:SAM-dependent methyltransferase
MAVEQSDFYDDLVEWYPLLDRREDHEEECRAALALIRETLPGARTLLELGAGAGNNVSYLKQALRCTASDIAPGMLALSERANPDCEHVLGDMRTLRLDRQFDVVFIHDAICHLSRRADLHQALQTAFVHTRPGGLALIAPDCTKESFCEASDDDANDDGAGRSLQYVVRVWDPDPDDESYTTDYACLVRDGDGVRVRHVRHVEGLFTEAAWLAELRAVGFEPRLVPRDLPDDERAGPYFDKMFLCLRPA